MSRQVHASGFVQDGRRRAIDGIEAELARHPRFGAELLDGESSDETPPSTGIWGAIRGWLKRRSVRRTVFDKLAPPDALY